MIYAWLVFLLALGVQSSQAGCLLKHSDQLEYFFRELYFSFPLLALVYMKP